MSIVSEGEYRYNMLIKLGSGGIHCSNGTARPPSRSASALPLQPVAHAVIAAHDR